MKIPSFRKFGPFSVILVILVFFSYFSFAIYLHHISAQLVQNWLRMEELNIQQGNIYSAVSSNNRIYLSSGLIRSVMLLNRDNGQTSEVASFGEYISDLKSPIIEPGHMKVELDGLYSTLTYVGFKNRPHLFAVFKIESSAAALLFLVLLGMLICIVLGFSIYIRRLDRREEAERILVIKQALDNLIGEKDPEPFIVQSAPYLINEWDNIRKIFIRLKSELEQATTNKVTAQTASMLAHDLRMPLNSIERLILPESDLPAHQRKLLREALNRVYGMIDSLRYSDREMLVEPKCHLLDISVGRNEILSKANSLSKQVYFNAHPKVEVFVDNQKFQRAWLNLASNAIDFAKKTVHFEIDLISSDLLIKVIDDGPGVPDEFLPRLFQRGATHGKHDGTGLGLAYVRQIMRGHGGDVTYKRENGLTVFECRLPNAVVQKEEGSMKNRESTSSAAVPIRCKKVAICLEPKSLALDVINGLASQKTEIFTFFYEYDGSDAVVSNDEELLLRALEDGKEPIQINPGLSANHILERLILKFNLG